MASAQTLYYTLGGRAATQEDVPPPNFYSATLFLVSTEESHVSGSTFPPSTASTLSSDATPLAGWSRLETGGIRGPRHRRRRLEGSIFMVIHVHLRQQNHHRSATTRIRTSPFRPHARTSVTVHTGVGEATSLAATGLLSSSSQGHQLREGSFGRSRGGLVDDRTAIFTFESGRDGRGLYSGLPSSFNSSSIPSSHPVSTRAPLLHLALLYLHQFYARRRVDADRISQSYGHGGKRSLRLRLTRKLGGHASAPSWLDHWRVLGIIAAGTRSSTPQERLHLSGSPRRAGGTSSRTRITCIRDARSSLPGVPAADPTQFTLTPATCTPSPSPARAVDTRRPRSGAQELGLDHHRPNSSLGSATSTRARIRMLAKKGLV
ncbi:hypothetical protein C8R45DRAFT_1087685 [Mycena sanguinolenta]|nr:hypothetical protein C8R45DRAFT_1087685 [Mycena sanguinolenta]